MTEYKNLREMLKEEICRENHRWIGTASRLLARDGFEASEAFELSCKYASLHGPNGDGPYIEPQSIRHLLTDEEAFPLT